MVRTKQLARNSTGGAAPRANISRKAARVSEKYVIIHSLAACRRNVFAGFNRGNRRVAEVPPSVILSNVRGFLSLLGPTVRIPVSDLRLLLDDNIEVASDMSWNLGFMRSYIVFRPS
jgi:hypothetical protein